MEWSKGGVIKGEPTPLRVLFAEEDGDPLTTMRYDEDVICPKCQHLEPLIGWVRGKHECFTGRMWRP